MNGYVITDSNKKLFVCKDKTGYTLSTDPNNACIFESKTKANSIYISLPKIIRSKGVNVKQIKLQVDDDVMNEGVECNHCSDIDSSKYIVSMLSDVVAKLNCRHFELSEELSKCDRQRSDVEHYIEFNTGKLNACDGYKAYKMLQDVLTHRRKVKDELQIVQIALDRVISPDNFIDINNKIKSLETRKYVPREFKNLFE